MEKQLNNKIEKQIVEEILEDFKSRQVKKKSYETSWELNTNFLMGNQYCFINGINEMVDENKQYFWQEREVFNHIAPIIDLRLAKLNKIRPTLTVLPFSDDPKDIACAKVSKNLLKSVAFDLNLANVLNEGTMWSEICGTAFYKIGWNSNKGRIVKKDELGRTVCEGEVELSVVSPYEIFPENGNIQNIDDQKSIMQVRAYNVQDIKDIWGVDVDGEELKTFSMGNIKNLGGLGYGATSFGVQKQSSENQALVIEKYERPTTDYPNGRLTIVAGDKLVYMGELPYVNTFDGKHGYPFVKQISRSVPNSFWGVSVIERLSPVQRAFNAVKNRKHEFLNRLTLGVLAVEDGSVDIESLEEEGLSPGKVLVYRQGATIPQVLSNDNIPSSFEKEEEKLLDEFLNIGGISDLLTSNSVQSGTISGVALELLVEQDEAKLSFVSDQIKIACKQIAKHILRLYKQFAVLPHTSRLIDENGKIEMMHWKNSDITSEDVVFETENEINQTIAQKRNMVFELYKSGIFTDENGVLRNSTRQKLLEQLGFGMWETHQDVQSLQVTSANNENYQLATTKKMPEPCEIDDHELHINEHICFVLGKEFEKLENKDEVKQIMLDHIKKHKEMLKQQKNDEKEV